MALHSPSSKVGIVAAQGVAAIANVELPVGQWPELIEILLGFVNNAANTPLRIATLNAIGYICESIVRSFFHQRSIGVGPDRLIFSIDFCAVSRTLTFWPFAQMRF